jgi:hypothetical protein
MPVETIEEKAMRGPITVMLPWRLQQRMHAVRRSTGVGKNEIMALALELFLRHYEPAGSDTEERSGNR